MKQTLLSGLLASLIISSCSSPRFVSAPPAMNNPIFTKSGEAKVAAFYSDGDGGSGSSSGRSISGYDVQGAASFAKRLFVTGSYSYKKEKDVYTTPSFTATAAPFDSATVNYSRRQFEAGAGFFIPLSAGEKVMYKFMAGYGGGSNKLSDTGNSVTSPYFRSHQSAQRKIFFQTGFDFRFAPHVTGFIAGKRSYNWFRNINTLYTPAEQEELNLAGLGQTTLAFTELGMGMSAGHKALPGLRLEGFLNFIVLNNNRRSNGQRYRSRTLNASIGIGYTFSFGKARTR